jgi:hypothetical protein
MRALRHTQGSPSKMIATLPAVILKLKLKLKLK